MSADSTQRTANESVPDERALNTALTSLAGLFAKLPFYSLNLEAPLQAIYPATPAQALVFQHLKNKLTGKLPASMRVACTKAAIKLAVDREQKCPTPALLKNIMAEAALTTALGTNPYDRARERAKTLLAITPSPEQGEEWMSRVLYAAVRAIGRETFATALTADPSTHATWQATLAEFIFTDSELQPWPSRQRDELVRKRRDFSALVASL